MLGLKEKLFGQIINLSSLLVGKKPVMLLKKIGLFTQEAKNATTLIKAFEIFFDNTMLEMLITETNNAIGPTREKMSATKINSEKNTYFR